MTCANQFLASTVLRRLHAIEDDLEHENALNPDARLTEAEIVVHSAITDVQRLLTPPVRISGVVPAGCCGGNCPGCRR